MRRIIPILIVSTLLSACSVDVTTDLIPTTANVATTLDVPDNEAFAILLLEFRDISDEFLRWFGEQTQAGEQLSTIGEYVAWGYEGQPVANEILDRWDAKVSSIEEYLGSSSLSVTDNEIQRFVSVARTFSEGHRAQSRPDVSCIDQIPETYYGDPASKLLEIPSFLDCFGELLDGPLVDQTTKAGAELPTAYNALYVTIFGGG